MRMRDMGSWVGSRRGLVFLVALVAWAGAAGGCNVGLEEGVYQCDLDGPRGCPPGWVCSLRPEDQVPRCYREPQHSCGNSVMEVTEECDGTDFGDQSCASATLGLPQGHLACTDDCTLDTSECHQCGNGSVEGSESCDGSDLAGGTCAEVTGKPDGALSCDGECRYDTSMCHECGDGFQESGEDCDGMDLGGATCADVGADGGELACNADCTFDRTGCFECGDGVCSVALGEDASQCSAECGWAQVATGAYHTCGVLGDGSVWCWGVNEHGQLGSGTLANSASPVHVVELPEAAVGLSAGRSHTCAVLQDGTLWCWGDNSSGQIAPDAQSDNVTPVLVSDPAGQVAQVACGDDFTCIRLASDGTVWCWGANALGQLGDGTGTDSATPVAVTLSTAASDIGAGSSHACAVLSDGSVWCWGDNGAGQVLGGGSAQYLSPQEVGVTSAVSVAPGDRHTCVVDQSGQAWCWGRNAEGALGNGTLDATTLPVLVHTDSQVTALSLGTSFSCGVMADRFVWCWGSNADGRLGIGSLSPGGSATPLKVLEVDDGQQVSAGFAHACALYGVGSLRCWGSNDHGQLGDGSTTDSATPVLVLDSRYWQ